MKSSDKIIKNSYDVVTKRPHIVNVVIIIDFGLNRHKMLKI